MAPKLAGAADAALHLIENEECARVIAELPKALQELCRRWCDAALALHWFNKHSTGLALLYVRCRRLYIEEFGLQAACQSALPENPSLWNAEAGGGGGKHRTCVTPGMMGKKGV